MLDMKLLFVFNIFIICKYSFINSPTVLITKGNTADIASQYDGASYVYVKLAQLRKAEKSRMMPCDGTSHLYTPVNAIR